MLGSAPARRASRSFGAAQRDVEAKLKQDVRQLQRWDQRLRSKRAVAAAGGGAAQRDAGGEARSGRHQF